MEQIRERARDGLLAAPRVGVGVGGLLLGTREGGRTRIVDSIEIACCHSGGPSFKLTPEEMQQAREMMAEAGEITRKTRIAVIGWYCSKTRGDAVLNEFDQQFHDELFPQAWQIALMLRPNAAEPMRAVFYFRDETGVVSRGVESEVEEWARPAEGDAIAVAAAEQREAGPAEIKVVEPPARAAAKVIEMSPPPRPVESTLPAANARPQETTLADIIGAGAVEGETPLRPRPAAAADLFGVPILLSEPPQNTKKQLIIGVGAAALVLIAGGAWFTRPSWTPAPPVNLSSSELNGDLLIRWNADAVKGIDHGTMYIADGSGKPPETVALDHFQLGSGLLNYKLKTKQATATLDAGSLHERTAWFAPPAPASQAGGVEAQGTSQASGAATPSVETPQTKTLPAAPASVIRPPSATPAGTKPITTAPAQDSPQR
jgi:hypothetical protein